MVSRTHKQNAGDLMINFEKLTDYIETARAQHHYAVLMGNGFQIDGTRIALMALYELMFKTLKEKNMYKTNASLKLVVLGDESNVELMNHYQYEQFLRRASKADFDTHLAIDVDLNGALVEKLTSVIADCNELSVQAQFKLVQGGKN
jgi:hypothetical protein